MRPKQASAERAPSDRDSPSCLRRSNRSTTWPVPFSRAGSLPLPVSPSTRKSPDFPPPWAKPQRPPFARHATGSGPPARADRRSAPPIPPLDPSPVTRPGELSRELVVRAAFGCDLCCRYSSLAARPELPMWRVAVRRSPSVRYSPPHRRPESPHWQSPDSSNESATGNWCSAPLEVGPTKDRDDYSRQRAAWRYRHVSPPLEAHPRDWPLVVRPPRPPGRFARRRRLAVRAEFLDRKAASARSADSERPSPPRDASSSARVGSVWESAS